MSTPECVERDERTVTVENASYRWAYLFLAYALLADVLWLPSITAGTTYQRHDGQIQNSEVELIQYDPSQGKNGNTIYTYQAPPPLLGILEATWSYSWLCDPASVSIFKSGLTRKPLARNVDGVKFYVLSAQSTVQRPIFEFSLSFVRDQQATTQYGAVSLRAPANPPSP